MYYRLPDIEHAGVILGKDAGKSCRLAGVVLPGKVNQNCLAHRFISAYQRRQRRRSGGFGVKYLQEDRVMLLPLLLKRFRHGRPERGRSLSF